MSLYRIEPARDEDIRWAAALATRVFVGADVIAEATMLSWFRTNPNGFFTFWYGDRRIGNFDVLPLKPEPMRRFVAGDLLEMDFTADCLCSPAASAEIRDLHWESIAVDPAFTGARAPLLKLFALTWLDLLGRLCPVEQIGHVYAISASPRGTGVLRRLGLAPVGDAATRRDAHPLFQGTVASYRAAMTRLGRPGKHLHRA